MTERLVFVTGATGFVGRHVVPQLLADGVRLRIAIRRQAGTPAAWAVNGDRVSTVEIGPIEDATNLATAVDGCAAILHLAGLAGLPPGTADAERRFMRANADATARMSQAARAAGVPGFVHMSSIFAVAGEGLVDDATVPRPLSPYGRSKAAAEAHVKKLADSGCFAVSIRPPLVIGADARGNWAALQRLCHTGLPLPFAGFSNVRSMIDADTLAGLASTLVTGAWPASRSGAYAVADPQMLTIADAVRALRDGMGMRQRLFAVPGAAVRLAGHVPGLGSALRSLAEEMIVDASRFHQTFQTGIAPGLREAIRRSGRIYAETALQARASR